jgi:hypothetical protein
MISVIPSEKSINKLQLQSIFSSFFRVRLNLVTLSTPEDEK